MAWKVHNEAD